MYVKCKILNHFPSVNFLTLPNGETYTGPMLTARTITAIALMAGSAIALSPSMSAQARQRSIYASALNEQGDPVEGMTSADFEVREDKTAREVLTVRPASDPMQIALLIDNSAAADPFIRDYRQAFNTFIDVLAADGAKHEVAVITLADRPTIMTDYTADLARAKAGTQRIFSMPGSGTYLLDGIIETTNGITKREASRPVIVVLTAEGPELSNRVYQAVLEPLKASGAAMHVVVIGTPVNMTPDRGMVLSRGTRDSGGRYDNVLASSGLPSRLKQVATELTSQYLVTYARPESLIPPDEITIGSLKPGVTVRGTPAKAPKDNR